MVTFYYLYINAGTDQLIGKVEGSAATANDHGILYLSGIYPHILEEFTDGSFRGNE